MKVPRIIELRATTELIYSCGCRLSETTTRRPGTRGIDSFWESSPDFRGAAACGIPRGEHPGWMA